MDDTQIIQAVTRYRERLTRMGLDSEEIDHGLIVSETFEALQHVQYMLDQMGEMLQPDQREKLMRWLGFAQGVLWAQGIYNLDELKDHNR